MIVSVTYYDDKQATILDPIVSKVSWSGDVMQASRRVDIELSNTINGKTRAVRVQKGKVITVKRVSDNKELFRGIIFKDDIDIKGKHKLTAYDVNIYLTKNKDTKKFVSRKASQIVQSLASEFGIRTGKIDDTGYVIPKMILRDKTLYEMIVTALTETRKHTGKSFMISSNAGKLEILERKHQAVQWVLENGTNILDASYSQSIEELRNQVKVMGEDKDKKPLVATVRNDKLIETFGLMQHLETVSSDSTKAQIDALAKQLLKDLATIEDEAELEVLGNTEVISGKAVYVTESMTGIIGGYYISSDEHEFEGNNHIMTLTLSATDELPTMKYEPPKETEKKEKKK